MKEGRLDFGDGRVYNGQWLHGLMDGNGKMIEEDGTIYMYFDPASYRF